MRLHSPTKVTYLMSRVAVASLLGTAPLIGMSITSRDCAFAACVNHHVNVASYDASGPF